MEGNAPSFLSATSARLLKLFCSTVGFISFSFSLRCISNRSRIQKINCVTIRYCNARATGPKRVASDLRSQIYSWRSNEGKVCPDSLVGKCRPDFGTPVAAVCPAAASDRGYKLSRQAQQRFRSGRANAIRQRERTTVRFRDLSRKGQTNSRSARFGCEKRNE